MTGDTGTPLEQDAGWELLPHDADVCVHGWGPTLATAFEQAALALTRVVTDAPIVDRTAVTLTCEAPDRELLLVEWLNALVYEMAVRGMVFGRFQVVLDDCRLHATLWGESLDRARHVPACEVKGATYTALTVSRMEGGRWSARCVVDV
jgi:SHS2 domain-containing protein